MMTLQTDLLAIEDIQAHIQDQQAQLQAQLVEARKELEDQQVRRATVQKAMTEKRGEISQAQTWLGYKEQDVRSAEADLEASRGTTLEAGKLATLAAATEARDKAKHESAQLVTLLERDTQAEANFTEQINALAARIEQLSHKYGELQATHSRWDRELCEHIKVLSLAELQACDNEIATADATLEHLQARREETVRQRAKDLAPWPDEARAFLIEHADFPDSPIVQALQSRLNSLNALEGVYDIHPRVLSLLSGALPANLYRDYGGLKGFHEAQEAQRARNGSWIITTPAYQKFEMDMIALEGFLNAERAEWKRDQARALLGIPKPPVTAVVEVERVEPPLVVIE